MPRCQHYRDGTHGLRQLIGARSHRGHTLVLPSLLLSGHFYCSGLCSTTRCVGGFCSHAGRNYNHSSVWHAIQPVHANRCQSGLMPLLECGQKYVEKLYFVPMLYGLEDVSVIVLKASLTERMRKTCKDGGLLDKSRSRHLPIRYDNSSNVARLCCFKLQRYGSNWSDQSIGRNGTGQDRMRWHRIALCERSI
jgi:hypothetical protein